jgi:hypothetical protein
VLLRQVELALLLKTRARVALAEGLVLGPFLGELLGELEDAGGKPTRVCVCIRVCSNVLLLQHTNP